MDQVNIYEAKKRLSTLLKRVEQGETIMISNYNKPIAELSPVRKLRDENRPFGLCRGEFIVPDDFDAPLPDKILSDFEL